MPPPPHLPHLQTCFRCGRVATSHSSSDNDGIDYASYGMWLVVGRPSFLCLACSTPLFPDRGITSFGRKDQEVGSLVEVQLPSVSKHYQRPLETLTGVNHYIPASQLLCYVMLKNRIGDMISCVVPDESDHRGK